VKGWSKIFFSRKPVFIHGGVLMLSFTVNKQRVNLDVDPSTPLLWVLRENLGLTGTKYGCGMAQCGACTVHLNGEAVRSCVAPVSRAQICRSIKDPKQNKNRNLDQLVEHLTEDKLAMWGRNPGEGRTPIPMPHDEFAAKVKQWHAAGASCPADTGKQAKL
jgi:ferredoxin